MPKVETLTKFEWEIMKQVWKKGRATVREVHEALAPTQSRAYTTIQTYMERLVDKKYLSKKKIGLVNFYSAKVKETDTLRREASLRRFIFKTGRLSFRYPGFRCRRP